jgi:hypothetical protein
MSEVKCDTLENIELMMPQLHSMFAQDSKSLAIAPRAIAPLAEAIVTLAREIRALRAEGKESES